MIEVILEKLVGLVGPIATLSKDRREQKELALRAVSNALVETKLYYKGRTKETPRNLETEALLAKYWAAAAIPLRHFDQELSIQCENKADYWLNPTMMESATITRLGIKLEDLSKAYRAMLSPKSRQ